MKTCNLQDFLTELQPWLDRDHIHDAELDGKGHLTLHFNDGMKNVYAIDDCNAQQMQKIVQQLKGCGIPVRGA
ncbi:MAG TPA: hypothetical protein VLL73_04975 [Desulfurivibrionaceae bacterium]|nr:hypothetical protein [Desulfurivibrionaceae bacterium]